MEFAEFITVPCVHGAVLSSPNVPDLEGTLCITGHHLILGSRGENKEEFWLLHRNIDLVERKTPNNKLIVLYCKDFRVVNLFIPDPEECAKVALSIEKLSNIGEVTLMYPFYYKTQFDILEDGWLAFTPEAEYAKYKNSSDLRLSNVNQSFRVCKSYPSVVVVPKCIDDDQLTKAAAFRHHGRFPVLAYLHKTSGTFLIRSSQPLVGTSNRRCREDEELLNAYVMSGKNAVIIDTRKASIAKSSQQKGGGFESETAYPKWSRVHQPVQRWNVLQESLSVLIDACHDSSLPVEKYLNKLNSSHWLDYSRDVLICACVVCEYINKDGATVLVHGAAGTDSTLQVTSMAQVLLDPDCRTIRGFEALIEREWLQAGHPFGERCFKSVYAQSHGKAESPVFLLFLDCVWQVWQQYPCSFEFNENFLLTLFENAYCSKYGTFLCNNAWERKQCKIQEKTVSLWSFINRPEFLKDYLNPLYEPNSDVLSPSVVPQSLTLWQGLYMRYQSDQSMQKEMWETIASIKERNSELQLKASRLRRQIDVLTKELQEEGISSSDVLIRNGQ